MGLIEDLKNLYNEAQDEVAQRAKQAQQQQGAPAAGRPQSIDELRERLRQQNRRANNPPARPARAAPAEAPADAAVQRHAARHAERHAAERLAEKEAAKAKAATHSAHERMSRLMHQPRTLRDLVVLKELLDRPLALRRFPHQR
jgi:hypothetical protein